MGPSNCCRRSKIEKNKSAGSRTHSEQTAERERERERGGGERETTVAEKAED